MEQLDLLHLWTCLWTPYVCLDWTWKPGELWCSCHCPVGLLLLLGKGTLFLEATRLTGACAQWQSTPVLPAQKGVVEGNGADLGCREQGWPRLHRAGWLLSPGSTSSHPSLAAHSWGTCANLSWSLPSSRDKPCSVALQPPSLLESRGGWAEGMKESWHCPGLLQLLLNPGRC